MRRMVLLLGLFAAVAAVLAAGASADYGPGTQYQVEISANNVQGGNFWFWAAIGPGTESDYENTDCIHTVAGGNPTTGAVGAGHSSGTLDRWSFHDGMLEMDGVKIIGGHAIANFFILNQAHSNWFEIVVTSEDAPYLPVGVPLQWSGRQTQVQIATHP